MLGPAQSLGLARRIEERLRPVGPGEPPQRRFEFGHQRARRGRKHAAFALHHDAARLGQARGDERDARLRVGAGDRAHPLGARAGLAEAAPRADQPDAPVAFGGELLVAAPDLPVPGAQRGDFVRAQRLFQDQPALQPLVVGLAEPDPAAGLAPSHRPSPRSPRCAPPARPAPLPPWRAFRRSWR